MKRIFAQKGLKSFLQKYSKSVKNFDEFQEKSLKYKNFIVDFEIFSDGTAKVQETYVLDIQGYKEGFRSVPTGIRGGNDGIEFTDFGEIQHLNSIEPYSLVKKKDLSPNTCKFTKNINEVELNWCFDPTKDICERKFQFSYLAKSIIQDKSESKKLIKWIVTPTDTEFNIEQSEITIRFPSNFQVESISASVYENERQKHFSPIDIQKNGDTYVIKNPSNMPVDNYLMFELEIPSSFPSQTPKWQEKLEKVKIEKIDENKAAGKGTYLFIGSTLALIVLNIILKSQEESDVFPSGEIPPEWNDLSLGAIHMLFNETNGSYSYSESIYYVLLGLVVKGHIEIVKTTYLGFQIQKKNSDVPMTEAEEILYKAYLLGRDKADIYFENSKIDPDTIVKFVKKELETKGFFESHDITRKLLLTAFAQGSLYSFISFFRKPWYFGASVMLFSYMLYHTAQNRVLNSRLTQKGADFKKSLKKLHLNYLSFPLQSLTNDSGAFIQEKDTIPRLMFKLIPESEKIYFTSMEEQLFNGMRYHRSGSGSGYTYVNLPGGSYTSSGRSSSSSSGPSRSSYSSTPSRSSSSRSYSGRSSGGGRARFR